MTCSSSRETIVKLVSGSIVRAIVAGVLFLAACGDLKKAGDLVQPIGGDAGDTDGASTRGPWRDGGAGSVKAIAIGGWHSCALLDGGRLRCWGSGPLGYGDAKTAVGDDETPASVGDVPLDLPVVQVAAGYGHTCVVLEGGAVRCWGINDKGQLGYGNGDYVTLASAAGNVDVGGPVMEVAAGGDHTCALLANGNVRCWGFGLYGVLGYANTRTIGDDETPATAGDVNVGGKVIQLAAGHNVSCALLEQGTVRCWGEGYGGALGYGNGGDYIGDDESPARAGDVDLGGRATAITTSGEHTCALLEGGSVRCWGMGASGVCGYGRLECAGYSTTPASFGDVPVGGKVVEVSALGDHTCALLEGGSVRCWGAGHHGQLGYGNMNDIGDDETPASAGDVDVGAAALHVAAGTFHTCAVLTNGRVRCWGFAHVGMLGYGPSVTRDIGDDEPPRAAGDVPLE
jgi:alpha-tubulin suppressor-like RCC1 family protein